jgi:repressor LexA
MTKRPPPGAPTARQQQVLDFLRRHVAERGFPPTIAEIAAHFGMRSPNAAAQHLRLLVRKGAIEVAPNLSRGIRVVAAAGALPIVGRVAAGSPILAEENREGSLAIDPRAFRPRADYLLRVRGDSMTGAGILDGDLVAVHRTPEARSGSIAVVRVGGPGSVGGAAEEVTVKRFRRQGARVSLLPENPRLRPLEVDLREEALAIEGIVVGVVRLSAGP